MLQLDARQDLVDTVTFRMAGSILHASPTRMIEALALVQQTRLRIPLLTADDCIHGHSIWPGATIFPTQLAMACSWDPTLIKRGARAAAIEISAPATLRRDGPAHRG
jgi:beta-glucosidase